MIHTKPTGRRSLRERGGALVMSVFLVTLMVALASAMMTTAHQQSRLSHSAVGRTRVLYIAESGIHAAAVNLYGGGSGSLGSAVSPLSYGGGTYYVTAVDNGNDTFTLRCDAAFDQETQAIEVTIALDYVSLFTKGLFGDIDLGATGTVFTDSYDSTLGTYASQATQFDPKSGKMYALANGDLGSNGDITLRGTVTVMGDATPGPGHTVYGDTSGVYGSTTPAPTATPIPTVTYTPPIGSSGALSGTTTLTAGVHRYDSVFLKSSDVLTATGDVTLYVDGNWSQTASASVVIAPGATLRVYHNGDTIKLTGAGVVNLDQNPAQFQLYSTATKVDIGGTSDFYGAIYAPSALISPGGTGVLYGSFVGSEVYISGTADFHYDEDLANLAESLTPSKVRILSWHFVKPI